MYSLMNHELVHVATSDVASDEDRRWRRFFLGKVSPQSTHPESLLYSYLTVPRFTAPRWYLEGSAVFMETWMAGGLGRAQGGYDEMVFRAMVRDDAHFYDPLGLESRGIRVDFQVGANAYLYGTRFITWLAYAHSPEKVVAWLRRDEGSQRYYADQFEHVFGMLARRGLAATGSRSSASSSARTSRRCASIRSRRTATLAPTRAGLGLAHVYDEATRHALRRRSAIPGFVEHVGAIDTRDGSGGTSPTSRARCSIRSPRSPTTRRAARCSTRTTTTRCAT